MSVTSAKVLPPVFPFGYTQQAALKNFRIRQSLPARLAVCTQLRGARMTYAGLIATGITYVDHNPGTYSDLPVAQRTNALEPHLLQNFMAAEGAQGRNTDWSQATLDQVQRFSDVCVNFLTLQDGTQPGAMSYTSQLGEGGNGANDPRFTAENGPSWELYRLIGTKQRAMGRIFDGEHASCVAKAALRNGSPQFVTLSDLASDAAALTYLGRAHENGAAVWFKEFTTFGTTYRGLAAYGNPIVKVYVEPSEDGYYTVMFTAVALAALRAGLRGLAAAKKNDNSDWYTTSEKAAILAASPVLFSWTCQSGGLEAPNFVQQTPAPGGLIQGVTFWPNHHRVMVAIGVIDLVEPGCGRYFPWEDTSVTGYDVTVAGPGGTEDDRRGSTKAVGYIGTGSGITRVGFDLTNRPQPTSVRVAYPTQAKGDIDIAQVVAHYAAEIHGWVGNDTVATHIRYSADGGSFTTQNYTQTDYALRQYQAGKNYCAGYYNATTRRGATVYVNFATPPGYTAPDQAGVAVADRLLGEAVTVTLGGVDVNLPQRCAGCDVHVFLHDFNA